MNYFVIQCYGKKRILQEAKFCVLSLLKFIKDDTNYSIILYTDNNTFFDDIKDHVVFEPMLPEMVQQWKGEHNFVHRVKVMMLLDFVSKYEGKFLYLDSDTWFTKSPQQLFEAIDAKNAILHLPEAQLKSNANPIIKKIHRFVKENIFTLSNGEEVQIPLDYFMWNAGVIGLTTQAKPVIEKVLELTDKMLLAYQKHVMEQLAFSYYLQKEFTPHRSDDVIAHYWQYCSLAEQPMKTFFDNLAGESIEAKVEAVHSFDWKPIEEYKKPSFWQKLKRKANL